MKTEDAFFAILDKYMGYIHLMYSKYADKKPIMELSLPSAKIYAYPYTEYLKILSNSDQAWLKKQYRVAIRSKKMVVFVKDNEKRTLKSCLLPIEEIERTEMVGPPKT